MKAAFFLLFAGLLAVQAANFRAVPAHDNELWNQDVFKNIEKGIHQTQKNFENGIQQTQRNIALTTNQINQNLAKAGQDFARTVDHVGREFNRAAHKFNLDLQKLRHAAEHGFSQAQQDFIRQAGPTIDALVHASGFTEASEAWKRINWKNLSGLDLAIQLTALRVQEIYEAVNGMGGGKLDEMAIDVAEQITTIFVPEAGIWFKVGKLGLKGGKVALRVVGQTHDITNMLKTMEYRVRRGDWGGVAIESHKLFSLILSDFAHEFRE